VIISVTFRIYHTVDSLELELARGIEKRSSYGEVQVMGSR